MFQLRPLAVGLIALPRFADPPTRRKARITLSQRAEAEGYAIAEIFEMDGRPVKDDAALSALEALTERIGTRTVLALGPLTQPAHERLSEAQLIVLPLAPDGEPAAGGEETSHN
jgi:hypothetical protein